MIQYLHQPKEIKFKNRMVNDDNQHFSGGWSIEGKDLSDEALLRRVANGLKPMAIIHEWKAEQTVKYQKIVDILKDINQKRGSDKLVYKESEFERTYCLTVACDGIMKNLFDLKTLKEDYESDISIDISKVKDKALSDYFNDWDAQDPNSKIEYWETGLILGYPIENTISLYRDGIRGRN